MTAPESGGAAFNPTVRTQDNTPAPVPDEPCADRREGSTADNGETTGEDRGNGVR